MIISKSASSERGVSAQEWWRGIERAVVRRGRWRRDGGTREDGGWKDFLFIKEIWKKRPNKKHQIVSFWGSWECHRQLQVGEDAHIMMMQFPMFRPPGFPQAAAAVQTEKVIWSPFFSTWSPSSCDCKGVARKFFSRQPLRASCREILLDWTAPLYIMFFVKKGLHCLLEQKLHKVPFCHFILSFFSLAHSCYSQSKLAPLWWSYGSHFLVTSNVCSHEDS